AAGGRGTTAGLCLSPPAYYFAPTGGERGFLGDAGRLGAYRHARRCVGTGAVVLLHAAYRQSSYQAVRVAAPRMSYTKAYCPSRAARTAFSSAAGCSSSSLGMW